MGIVLMQTVCASPFSTRVEKAFSTILNYSDTKSMGSGARTYEKLMKNEHWNFQEIIAWKTSLVW